MVKGQEREKRKKGESKELLTLPFVECDFCVFLRQKKGNPKVGT